MTANRSAFISIELNQPVAVALRGGVVAIGNFDGIHRGHQAVLALTKDIARSENRPALAMTFEPHPRTFFNSENPVFRLTPGAQKQRIIEKLGFDGVVVVPFDENLAATQAGDFVENILIGMLGAGHVIAGYDFHFGRKRLGTPAYLQQAGQQHGFGVTTVPSFDDDEGVAVSSSRIRAALSTGAVGEAAGLLGYRWQVEGKVQRGKKLGRTLGFPTANLALPQSFALAHGIYAVRLRRENGALYDGVASFGRRPTFDNGTELLETFVFDFDEDLYDENVVISLFGHLRAEEKFSSADALVVQMEKDAAQANGLLARSRPLSMLDKDLNY